MNLRITRRVLLAMAAAIVLVGTVEAADPVKVGFVYVGSATDNGWNYRHDHGRLAVEKAFGDKVKTTFVENVAEGPDSERVIRQLAASGHKLIFTTSFGFMNATIRVAKRFPKVMFEHATGYQRTKNVSTYAARFYQGRAVIGTIAGHMSKTGVVGYIGSFPIPEVVRGINAFALAAQKINPDIKVRVVWVNTWTDPGKEADAAKALIDQGVDIITQHTDTPAPLQVAQERGVFGFGQAADMAKFAPNSQLTSIVDNWDPYYISRVDALLKGTWKSGDTWDGLKEGMVSMAAYSKDVPADVAAAADKIKKGIIDGSFHPFTGPIKNQKGEIVVKAGETISDGDLVKMDWYVQGVEN